MGRGGTPDEKLLEAVALVKQYGSVAKACRATGIADSTLGDQYRKARYKGLHVDPAIKDSMQAVGTNMVPHLAWAKTKSEDGTSYSVLLKPEQEGEEDLLERFTAAFEGIPAATPIAPPKGSIEDSLAFLPHADWHLGMVSSVEQTGRDYNRKIAIQRLTDGMGRCLDRQAQCERALIVNAGDLTHANDDTDRTPRHKHVVKSEGTHYQNLDLCIQTTATLIEMALKKHRTVKYRAIAGNHDPSVPGPLSFALRERYRNEKRVEIVCKEDKFWQESWGNNFFVGHHGDGRSAKEIAASIPYKFSEEFSRAKHWFYFTGHRHRFLATPYNGLMHYQLPSVCSLDSHASDLGYNGDSGLIAMTFQKSGGCSDMYRVYL